MMKKYAQIYTLFLMFVFCISSKGQNKTELPKDNIKSETKDVITSQAPNNITRTIIQDRKGNIWMAAFDGIFRYNGKSFTKITNEFGKPFTNVRSIIEDKKGNIWTSSISAYNIAWALSRYDGKSLSNSLFIKPAVTEIKSNEGMKEGSLGF